MKIRLMENSIDRLSLVYRQIRGDISAKWCFWYGKHKMREGVRYCFCDFSDAPDTLSERYVFSTNYDCATIENARQRRFVAGSSRSRHR